MTDRAIRSPRAEPKEIVELRHLKEAQPELAAAVDLQIELLDTLRRVQARVPLPRLQPDAQWLAAQQRERRPAVRFIDIPLEWSDFRFAVRQVSDILRRHGALEGPDHERILALSRDGNALEPLASGWYTATSRVDAAVTTVSVAMPQGLDHVLLLALRPFLARCAEALMPRQDFQGWAHAFCPVCGWEADFAVITPSAERRLICGRCLAQWAFDSFACPYCDNRSRDRITSFATRDGRYRVYACDVCTRYLKAYDGRHTARPVMVQVDSIATLPLDAAAIQRGYTG